MHSGAHSPTLRADKHWYPWRAALVWLAVGVLWRVSLAALVPPLPDETYYWEWTRHIQLSYFDHPPVIALLIRAGTFVFGDTQAGIRAGPAVAGLIASVCVALLARNLASVDSVSIGEQSNAQTTHGAETNKREARDSGVRAATRAAAITSVLPMATLGLVLATPDAPLIALVALSLLALERALNAPSGSKNSTVWWAFAGAITGTALGTKYTAVLLPISFLVAGLIHPTLRKHFREPGPWLAGAIALLVFAPVVIWNAQNNWVSFRFQFDHGFSPATRGTSIGRELEYIGAQFGLASPVLFVLMALAVSQAARVRVRGGAVGSHHAANRPQTGEHEHIRRHNDVTARRFAIAFVSIVPVVFFAISAWKRPVEPNWPALVYPGAMALLGASTATWATSKLWKWGIGIAITLCMVATAQAIHPILPLDASKDPIARAYGFDSLTKSVERARRDTFFTSTRARIIAATRYEVSSEIAFRLPEQPHVHCIWIDGRPNQYDFWPTFFDVAKPGDDLVAVYDADAHGDAQADTVGTWFESHRLYETVALTRGSGVVKRRRVWLYRNAQRIPRQMARLPSAWAPR